MEETVGLYTTEEPVKLGLTQVYVNAPEAVKETGNPAQLTVVDETAVTVGNRFTPSETVVVFAHAPLSPVTVYIVAEVGLTTATDPLIFPGNQV